MASKLEYLQRYMSSAGAADAAGEKKLRKKKKKASASSARSGDSRFRVVDADHEWEQDAPSKDAIEQKWEQDAADEERPVVVADGEIVDPTDLPVYVNAEEYLDELNAKQRGAAKDDDLSPPRKSRESERSQANKSSDEAKPRSRTYSSDGSPPRKASAARRGQRQPDRDEGDDTSPPRRRRDQAPARRKAHSDSENDASPPQRSQPARRGRKDNADSDGDASPPRRKPASRQSEERFSGKRRSAADAAASDSDASPARRPPAAARKSPLKTNPRDDDASPPRRRRADASDGDASSPRRRSVKSKKPEEQRKEPPRLPQPRRTDSLGRDIPYVKKETSRANSNDSGTSPPRRRGESSRNRSRSPSNPRGRERSQSHPRHQASRVGGGSGRSRSRSRSTSPRRRRGRSPSRSKSNRRRYRSESRSRSPARRTSDRHSETRQSRRASRSRSGSAERRRGQRRLRSPAQSGRQASRPERRMRSPDGDSPPRKHEKRENVKDGDTLRVLPSEQADEPKKDRKDDAEPQKARAGLFTAKEFAEEHKRKLRQNDFLRTADASDMGANAETVYRDKRGRKLDMLNEMVRQQEILDGKRKREAREEYEWGTGKVQKQELKSQRELMEQMQQAPFARHEDDPELEKLRKERVRAFDPMNSKVFQEDDLFGGGKSSKKSKSKKKSSAKPKYAGPPAPPNRFGIQPGYRWDGVVRGTGWEEKLLLRQNKQSAASEEAYRYAVADM